MRGSFMDILGVEHPGVDTGCLCLFRYRGSVSDFSSSIKTESRYISADVIVITLATEDVITSVYSIIFSINLYIVEPKFSGQQRHGGLSRFFARSTASRI